MLRRRSASSAGWFGGSWGSTLALAYAECPPGARARAGAARHLPVAGRRHPLVLSVRGDTFPEAWEDYLAPIPETERGDLVSAYYRRLTGDDEVERMRCAKVWSVWGGHDADAAPESARSITSPIRNMALSLGAHRCHYFAHDSFLAPDQLVRDVNRPAGIPGYIVHGRYDVICPLDGAWALHRAWPGSQLDIIADAGHAATGSPASMSVLVRATDAPADHYR